MRYRHPVYFGSLLTPHQISLFLPITVGTLGLFLIAAIIFVMEPSSASPGRIAGLGAFAGVMLLCSIWMPCILVGYALRARLELPPDLAAKIQLEPDFWVHFVEGLWSQRRIRYVLFLTGGNMRAAVWIVSVVVWIIVLVALQGILSGELTPDFAGNG